MAVTCQIDQAKRRIHTRCVGAVTTEIARARPRVQFDGCAIIASRDALLGRARMVEVFAERYFGASRVFRTMDEGTRGLKLEPVAR
jgi:hypothetical protein